MLRQNAGLTFKGNRNAGRHAWLRLTPAYSVALVRENLAGVEQGAKILDPFSGSGTTGLYAVERGLVADLLDINPFLVWFTKTKTRNYADGDLAAAPDVREEVLRLAASFSTAAHVWQPPIHKIERWWSPSDLKLLRGLRVALDEFQSHSLVDLLLIAFCRTLIGVSHAAFNHQSMSFKARNDAPTLWDTEESSALGRFAVEFEYVVSTARPRLPGKASVILGDSRTLSGLKSNAYDVLYTSPPYANRMSYVRELRPYMYWLRFIDEAREAGELDWRAIGGTWGIATSRLATWEPSGELPLDATFGEVLARIRNSSEKNGPLLSRYVHKYFQDVWDHLRSAHRVIAPGGRAIYVIGNSTFFGQVVHTEKWYAELMARAGFKEISVSALRKRNSKKELFEYAVTGRVE